MKPLPRIIISKKRKGKHYVCTICGEHIKYLKQSELIKHFEEEHPKIGRIFGKTEIHYYYHLDSDFAKTWVSEEKRKRVKNA